MEKISIKKFCETYTSQSNAILKEQYLNKTLKITPYVSFLMKGVLVDNILKITMFNKDTGNIKVDSFTEYLLLNRVFIENYTNLKVESQGFFEEYDMLKTSGLFNKLLVGNEDTNELSLIPYQEMAEFKYILDIKKRDIMTNTYNIPAYISNQVTRFGELTGVTLKPALDKIADGIVNMDDNKMEKILKMIGEGLKRIK